MSPRYLVLDRVALQQAVLAFLALSYERTTAPVTSGGANSLMREIPRSLRQSRKNAAGHERVFLSDDEADAYRDLSWWLGQLRETEWLSSDERESHLWTLACEVAIAPAEFRTERQRQARTRKFLTGVLRQLRPYTVLFPLTHLSPPEQPVTVWDSTIERGTDTVLAPYLAPYPPALQTELSQYFLNQALLRLPIEGTGASAVVERAREVALRRLHMLRGALATHWQTHEDQLRFSLGEHVLARALTGPADGTHTWARPRATPLDLVFHPGHAERLDELQTINQNLGRSHPSVRVAVERAYEWIGRGLTRQWPGDALLNYATAAEVLLVASDRAAEQDGRGQRREQKSVLLPYRMAALAELFGKSMIHPSVLRHAYDRRGLVIHEGQGDAGDDKTTHTMLRAARDCIDWLSRFAADHPDTPHRELLEALDTRALRDKVIAWLRNWNDPWTVSLVGGIESLPKTHWPGTIGNRDH